MEMPKDGTLYSAGEGVDEVLWKEQKKTDGSTHWLYTDGVDADADFIWTLSPDGPPENLSEPLTQDQYDGIEMRLVGRYLVARREKYAKLRKEKNLD